MKRNKFDFSHERQLSFNMGELCPFMALPILPGDRVRLSTENFIRFAPLIAPVMHRINCYIQYFFVPMRIVWDDAEEFFHRGKDRDSTITVPKVAINDYTYSLFHKRSPAHHMGIRIAPLMPGQENWISQIPLRSFIECWNEYYRNQDVQDRIEYDKSSANINTQEEAGNLCQMLWRNWEKDYFTGAKPSPTLDNDLTGVVPLIGGQDNASALDGSGVKKEDGTDFGSGGHVVYVQTGTGGPKGTLYADTKGINLLGIDIEDIRLFAAIKRWMEAILRYGYKYIDYVKAIWGVNSSDSRFQRPEYLGGMTQPVRISEVLNTSDTANAPQGNMSGHGLSASNGGGFDRTFEEHGYIIGIISCLPKTKYFQGHESHWHAFTHLDWPNPKLANLGMQEVKLREVYFRPNASEADNNKMFAYQHRYADWKSKRDYVSGEFTDTLKFWHFGREFSSTPGFDNTFISSNPKTTPFAVTSGDHVFSQIYLNIDMMRKLPYFAVPKID